MKVILWRRDNFSLISTLKNNPIWLQVDKDDYNANAYLGASLSGWLPVCLFVCCSVEWIKRRLMKQNEITTSQVSLGAKFKTQLHASYDKKWKTRLECNINYKFTGNSSGSSALITRALKKSVEAFIVSKPLVVVVAGVAGTTTIIFRDSSQYNREHEYYLFQFINFTVCNCTAKIPCVSLLLLQSLVCVCVSSFN